MNKVCDGKKKKKVKNIDERKQEGKQNTSRRYNIRVQFIVKEELRGKDKQMKDEKITLLPYVAEAVDYTGISSLYNPTLHICLYRITSERRKIKQLRDCISDCGSTGN